MFKIIDPQNISKRSFKSNKKFTVDNTTSASFGNSVVRAISGSHWNYDTGSDTVTHIVSGSISSSYYALPTYNVIRKLYYKDPHDTFGYRQKINRVLQGKANVFSIPRNLIGENIKPGSVKLSDTSKGITFDIRDDKDGNLYDFNYSGSFAAFKSSSFDRSQGLNAQGSGSQIGNIFYESGIMVITDTGSYADVGMGSSYSLEFKATQKHWEHEYLCTANQFEFNTTMNISATKNRSGSISITAGPENYFSDKYGIPRIDANYRKTIKYEKSPYTLLPPGTAPKGELISTPWTEGVIPGHGSSTMGGWSTDGTATVFSGSGNELILSASTGHYPATFAKAIQTVSVKKGKEYVLSGEYKVPTGGTNSGNGVVFIEESGTITGTLRSEAMYPTGSDPHKFKFPFQAIKDTHYIFLAMEKNQQHDETSWSNLSLKEWHGFNSGIGDYESEYNATDTFENFVTHSEFRPYVTQVGLYDEQDRLLAHAKLSKPIKLDNQYDTSFVVRFDV